MSEKASAGKIMIRPRGNYDENTEYRVLDLINFKGYPYLSKKTSIGIAPVDTNGVERTEYWHNLLDMNEIVQNAIAGTLAEDVGNILEERFRDIFAEAKYAEDLFSDYDEPTFVKWDESTLNAPTKDMVTSKGFALVYGNMAEYHTVVAWDSVGSSCIHHIFNGIDMGWDRTITSQGGKIDGNLYFGNKNGGILADSESMKVSAIKDNKNERTVEISIPSQKVPLEESVKLSSKVDGKEESFNLFGEHNPEIIAKAGFARIETGSYVGNGEYGVSAKIILNFSFVPKLLFIGNYGYAVSGHNMVYHKASSNIIVRLTWSEKTVTIGLYASGEEILNDSGAIYSYVAIG